MWHDIEQNTDDWFQLRNGKLTGSAIAKVMANNGKAFGEPAKKLAVDIAIQQVTGKVKDSSYTNDHMLRGHEQEPIARDLYENSRFCDVQNGGFYDNGFAGCSPDGIVNDGIIEIKSVIASTQYKTIKKGGYDSVYQWQIKFNLLQSRKRWIDYISYCSEFPLNKQLFICRVYAKDLKKDFAQIRARVKAFKKMVDDVKADIGEL